MASDRAAELQFAIKLADAADVITLPHFNARNFTVDIEANQTEVTEVDRGTETVIMDLISYRGAVDVDLINQSDPGGLTYSPEVGVNCYPA